MRVNNTPSLPQIAFLTTVSSANALCLLESNVCATVLLSLLIRAAQKAEHLGGPASSYTLFTQTSSEQTWKIYHVSLSLEALGAPLSVPTITSVLFLCQG